GRRVSLALMAGLRLCARERRIRLPPCPPQAQHQRSGEGADQLAGHGGPPTATCAVAPRSYRSVGGCDVGADFGAYLDFNWPHDSCRAGVGPPTGKPRLVQPLYPSSELTKTSPVDASATPLS